LELGSRTTEPAAFDGGTFESSLIWIFGSARSGSSWLMRLLGRHPRTVCVNEPGIGQHLVDLGIRSSPGPRLEFFRQIDLHAGRPDYFFAEESADCWRPLLRDLMLRRLHDARRRWLEQDTNTLDPWTVIKEPNGSQAADIILSTLPRSSLIFLVRDGRDVVDSALASVLGESWGRKYHAQIDERRRPRYIRHRASLWVYQMEIVQRAYEAHAEDRRILVRYEDLLSETATWLRRIMDQFGLTIEDKQLEAIVEAEDFENMPDSQKGPDKPARAATPGLWRENLSQDEQRMVTRIMRDKLRELGYTV
jgi:hypothetical protein